jgi:hypothetical protein
MTEYIGGVVAQFFFVGLNSLGNYIIYIVLAFCFLVAEALREAESSTTLNHFMYVYSI